MNARHRLGLIAAALLAVLPATTLAQAYPARPVKLLVPFPAGGPSDVAARVVAEAMTRTLGQPMVVENKPGADGLVAGQAVATAAPDGYTLLWGVASAVAGTPLLHKPAPYDPVDSFAPIGAVGSFTFTLAAHPDLPAKNVAELVEHARRHPDKLSYATGTLGEHMAAAQFMKATGTTMVRVPYKGGAQAMPDLLSGRVQLHFGPVSLHQPQAKDGKLRILATLRPQRSATVPDVPTLSEAGVTDAGLPTWQALLAPAKTPRDVVERLARELQQALADPGVRAQLEKQTVQVETQPTPEALAATIRRDVRAFEQFIRDNGVTLQ